ncbi:TIGR03086 family metal-binding protein [Modestobacter sp. NPDC049651]|uniref:TIGR03086 family metal-binding protein n=1 Tax=unclassified Modestobacter TaxID=2643866 RepID=UPI003405E01D
MLDLGPTAQAVAALLPGVRDDQLADPTPCAGTPVAGLLDHLHGLARGLAGVARKGPPGTPPVPDAARLPADWRTRVPVELDDLVAAWRDPAAWTGEAEGGGGIRLPGATWGRVTLNELVVHGWDLAVATGRPYRPDPDAVAACLRYVADFDRDLPGARDGIYGPVVPVAEDAPALDRLLGATGRDPSWRARAAAPAAG